MPRKRLTVKQQKFVKEYVARDGNGTQAALAVYDVANENVAHQIASENLQKPTIRERVEQALSSLDITPEKVIQRFNKQADKYEDINPNAAVRANEQLAHIANLYPSATNSLEIGDGTIKLSWGGTDIATNE